MLSKASVKNIKALVVGDIILDEFWFGDTSRISPESPVPIVNIVKKEQRPGGAANVAVNMASLGCTVTLLGVVGADNSADTLERMLYEHKISHNLIRCNSGTIVKTRVVSKNQQLIRVDSDKNFITSAENIYALFKEHLQLVDVVVLSDYAKGTLQAAAKFISMAKAAGVPVFVDPKKSDLSAYSGAYALTPNFTEFCASVGDCNDDTMVAKAKQLCLAHDLSYLVVTRAKDGISLISNKGEHTHITAKAKEVFDVTGAGDTVIAALAIGVVAGLSMASACNFANVAAGIVIGKLGTATVDLDEVNSEIANDGAITGVKTENELQKLIENAKLLGQKIVFTNGCFDILHAGHVSYLQEAKGLGDKLVVAVNSDSSVRMLKGDSRPINGLEDRMQVLSGLKSVDWVVPFSEETPLRIIKKLAPDVLVKAGDYTVDTIVGADFVRSNGGIVKTMGFLENRSTSSIIEKIMATEKSTIEE